MTAGPLDVPRQHLARLPTPLERVERLSAELDLEVWFKRDDLTGFGLGGNKVRALEYLLADAVARECDCLVTGAGPQSNWAMLAALAARSRGLDAYLFSTVIPFRPAVTCCSITWRAPTSGGQTGETCRASVDRAIAALTSELRSAGRRPYSLPRGGATAVGVLGYVWASVELSCQLHAIGLAPSDVWLATGSCGTQAGLVAGSQWLRASYRVVSVSVSRPPGECVVRVRELAQAGAQRAGISPIEIRDATVISGYIGPGYGRPSAAGKEAALLTARSEGVFLDPIFGAKAMAAFIDAARARAQPGPVVFLVTGGAPTLFASLEEER